MSPARPPSRRSWLERVAIVASITAAVLAFSTAAGLVVGYVLVRQRHVVSIENPAEAAGAGAAGPPPVAGGVASTQPAGDGGEATTAATTAAGDGDGTESTEATRATEATPATEVTRATAASTATTDAPETTPAATFPPVDPGAQNFLVTGADNGACIDPSSPYAAAFGDREGMGERSDTIMLFRIDPGASRLAVLSFPRDLYVPIAGTGNRGRINSAYQRDEPQRLIDTIYDNFGIGVDHFIQVDFCAFKTLVDAVGGVPVPFDYPARDPNTGLNVATTGCFTFDGEHALAYVRSRKYEYEYPVGSGEWHSDGTSDLGRISRQQDFLRRVLSKVLAAGPLDPAVAGGLIESAQNYVVTDDQLSPANLLEFAGAVKDIDPGAIPSYQIEATPRTVNGADVLEPNVDGDNMQEVLALFRGETSLAAAPTQRFETTTTPEPSSETSTAPASTAPVSVAEATTAPVDPSETTAVTLPGVPEENTTGIVPPRDVECS